MFNSFALSFIYFSVSSCSLSFLVTLTRLQKILSSVYTTSKSPSKLLNVLYHILPNDGSSQDFCVQSQFLTRLLHCNTCYMKRLDLETSSLSFKLTIQMFTFSCSRVCCQLFKHLLLNLISNFSIAERPSRYLLSRVIIVLRHCFWCLDRNQYDSFSIYLIAYNTPPVFLINT